MKSKNKSNPKISTEPHRPLGGTYPNKWYSEFAKNSAKTKGVTSISLGYGDPAIGATIPQNFQKLMAKHLTMPDAGAYSETRGEPALIEAFKKFIVADEKITSDFEIVIGTAGGRGILTTILKVLLNTGDIVLVPDPFWSGYNSIIEDTQGVIWKIPTTASHRFVPRAEEIESKIKEARSAGKVVKAIILNTPHNPTGTVYDAEVIEEILKVSRKYSVHVIGDYTYRQIRKGGYFIPSIYKIAEELALKEKCSPTEYTNLIISMQTLGKIMLTPGLRLGYVMSTNKDFISKFCKKKQAYDFNGHVFLQNALAEYLNTKEQQEDFERVADEFNQRRDFVLSRFENLGYSVDGGNLVVNDVGFYVSLKIPPNYENQNPEKIPLLLNQYPFIGESVPEEEYTSLFKERGYVPASELFALDIAQKAGVALCPGHLFTDDSSDFGYENWVRMALIQPVEVLEKVFKRFDEFLKYT